MGTTSDDLDSDFQSIEGIDQIADTDPGNPDREASLHFYQIINTSCSFIVEAGSPHVAAWAVAYALGQYICEGVSLSDRAETLGVTVQALSKQIKAFQHLADLPPSAYMYSK